MDEKLRHLYYRQPGAAILDRWRTALPAIWISMGALLFHCSLFVDTDGLTGGGSDASTFDSSSSNAPFYGDTSFDAGSSADAPNGFDAQFPGCAAPHALCDDSKPAPSAIDGTAATSTAAAFR